MQLVSKEGNFWYISGDFKNHLTIKLTRAILADIFLVSHTLLLFRSPKGSWNKFLNIRNSEIISHIALGTVR